MKTPVLTQVSLKITKKELEKIFNLFIDDIVGHLEKDEFELNYTTFWVMMFKEGVKLKHEGPTVGDLRDDVARLKEIAKINDDVMSLNDYEYLGNVIKALGHSIYNRKKVWLEERERSCKGKKR